MIWCCLYWRRGALRDTQLLPVDIGRAAFGEQRLELLCVGLRGRVVQGSAAGRGGRNGSRRRDTLGGVSEIPRLKSVQADAEFTEEYLLAVWP